MEERRTISVGTTEDGRWAGASMVSDGKGRWKGRTMARMRSTNLPRAVASPEREGEGMQGQYTVDMIR